ncbi:hypothetical protein Fmac_027711 [Flemingia macrophylla]|uniref:Chloroplast lumen common family protein n=1 Tax=Flemingia macrophylla TaxID=520843 RepID=A0ABD1LII4_9FABA
MASLPKTLHSHAHSLLQQQRASNFPRSPFPTLTTPFSKSSLSPTIASPKPQNPITHLLKTPTPLLKPTCLAIAAATLLLARLHSPPLAAAASSRPPPAATASETLPDADADALRYLMADKIRARRIGDAIRVLDRLIEGEPEEAEYALLKAHLHMRNGEPEAASLEFDRLVKKDPFHVEAYRGLLVVTSETNRPTAELLRRIEEAVRVCEERGRVSDARDFKLLVAQIKVIDGDFSHALKVYEEIVEAQPGDFRPYLCRGIVYALLRRKDEAEKQFQKYRSLVPDDHPYKQYFEDHAKIFESVGE